MPRSPAPTWRIIASFAAIYLFWGASYLGITFALESLPPLVIPGIRFTLAGLILMGLARRAGAAAPKRVHWKSAAMLGFLMFFVANSTLTLAQTRIPSSLAATLYATSPLWFALLGWLWQGEARPGSRALSGLVLGFVGIIVLFGPGTGSLDPLGGLFVLISSLSWTIGSLLSRRLPMPDSAYLGAGMNLFVSGLFCLFLSVVTGEMAQVDVASISLPSILAMVYLMFGASLLGFSSYMWLLTVTTPNRVATYAYVNPVIAMFLGVVLAGETLTGQAVVASVIIIGAVVLITTARPASKPAADAEQSSPRRRWKALTGWVTGNL
ncbi:MAG: EamA family transporter [Anaerolineae bacterium]|nr:EamA family transporter [Anaerolineae bacterium]